MNTTQSSQATHKNFMSPAGVFLTIAAFLIFASCRPGETPSKPADVDYYTCTMHPSVKSQDPKGKCPICGMDLVPVKKKTGSAGMPSMKTLAGEEQQPSEFNVPVARRQQIGVTYATVDRRPFHHTVRAVGLVAPDMERRWDCVTRVEGYVQKLFVFSPGERVTNGAPVLTIYSPELLAAQKEFVNSLKMRDNAKANGSPVVLAGAELQVDSERQRLRLWNIPAGQIADLEKTLQPRESLTLYSPFNGIVQDVPVTQGRKVAEGDRLVDIANLSVVWVWAQFYQDELPMLKKGLSMTVTMSSYPGEKFDGVISLIDPFVNESLRMGRVRIDVQNPALKLRPGMYADVELSMDMGEGLAVPVGAVLPTGLHNIAFVDEGEGKLAPRFIEISGKYGDYFEVKSGLAESERVVASANFLIDAEANIQGALKAW